MSPSLHDYEIRGPAEVGACGTAGSFRAVSREDASPVLLHRFRPADPVLGVEPRIASDEAPDFAAPFCTRITTAITAAGSAYLVEPLPVCATLRTVWHGVLLNAPEQVLPMISALFGQLRVIRHMFPDGFDVGLDSVVLTSHKTYGVLAASLPGHRGSYLLRLSGRESSPDDKGACGLPALVQSLLAFESQIAAARGHAILTMEQSGLLRAWGEASATTSRRRTGHNRRSHHVTP